MFAAVIHDGIFETVSIAEEGAWQLCDRMKRKKMAEKVHKKTSNVYFKTASNIGLGEFHRALGSVIWLLKNRFRNHRLGFGTGSRFSVWR